MTRVRYPRFSSGMGMPVAAEIPAPIWFTETKSSSRETPITISGFRMGI